MTPVASLEDHAVALAFLEAVAIAVDDGDTVISPQKAAAEVLKQTAGRPYTIQACRDRINLLALVMWPDPEPEPQLELIPETREQRIERLRQERRDRLKDIL